VNLCPSPCVPRRVRIQITGAVIIARILLVVFIAIAVATRRIRDRERRAATRGGLCGIALILVAVAAWMQFAAGRDKAPGGTTS
jgi:uncharacterized membrane protein YhaH (DUF805 family)